MSDSDKIHIKTLDAKSDYGLWKIRVEAACSAKGVQDALTVRVGVLVEGSQETTASGMIVSAIIDSTLLVVCSVMGDPAEMLSKLDARFESLSTPTNIKNITEFVSTRFGNIDSYITKNIDGMASILEQLKAMDLKIDIAIQVTVLIVSIDVVELGSVTAVIKTLSKNDITCEFIM